MKIQQAMPLVISLCLVATSIEGCSRPAGFSKGTPDGSDVVTLAPDSALSSSGDPSTTTPPSTPTTPSVTPSVTPPSTTAITPTISPTITVPPVVVTSVPSPTVTSSAPSTLPTDPAPQTLIGNVSDIGIPDGGVCSNSSSASGSIRKQVKPEPGKVKIDRDDDADDDHDEAKQYCSNKHDDEDCHEHDHHGHQCVHFKKDFKDHDDVDDDDFEANDIPSEIIGNSSIKELSPAKNSFHSLDFYIQIEEGGLFTCQVRHDGKTDPKKALGLKNSCHKVFSVDAVQKWHDANVIHDVRLRTKSSKRFQVVYSKLQEIYKNAKPGDKVHFHVSAIGKLHGPAIHIYKKKGLVVIRLDRCVVVDIDTGSGCTPHPTPSSSPVPQPSCYVQPTCPLGVAVGTPIPSNGDSSCFCKAPTPPPVVCTFPPTCPVGVSVGTPIPANGDLSCHCVAPGSDGNIGL